MIELKWLMVLILINSRLSNQSLAGDENSSRNENCTDVYEYFQKQFQLPIYTSLSNNELNIEESLICNQAASCCTPQLEKYFEENLFNNLNSTLLTIKEEWKNLTQQKYQIALSHFLNLFKKAQDFLDIIFYKTYQEFYRDRADIFYDFFSELKESFKNPSPNVESIFEKLYKRVLRRVFQLLHGEYIYNDELIECIGSKPGHMMLQGAPMKLPHIVRRSFEGPRKFLKDIQDELQLIEDHVEQVSIDIECTNQIIKLRYCAQCQNRLQIKPCQNSCSAVLKKCLLKSKQLEKFYQSHVVKRRRIFKFLNGNYQMHSVMIDQLTEPLSDAIMQLQSLKRQLKVKIFADCKEPPRNKSYKIDERLQLFKDHSFDVGALYNQSFEYQRYNYDQKRTSRDIHDEDDTQKSSRHDNLWKNHHQEGRRKNDHKFHPRPLHSRRHVSADEFEMRSKVKRLDQQIGEDWQKLIKNFCYDDHQVSDVNSEECWNGQDFIFKSSSSIVEKADDVTTKNDYSSNWLDEKDKKNLLPNNQKADLEPTFDSENSETWIDSSGSGLPVPSDDEDEGFSSGVSKMKSTSSSSSHHLKQSLYLISLIIYLIDTLFNL